MKEFWAKYRGLIIGLIVMVGLIVGSAILYTPPEKVVAIDYKHVEDATVILSHDYGLTSGVIISEDGYVLSCAHGGPPKHAYIKTYYDDMEIALIVRHDVEVVFMDTTLDLGIYKLVEDRKWSWVPLATEMPEQGEDVFSVGTPLGKPFYLSWGKTIKYLYSDYGQGYILHSCSTNQGNSGGPVFNMRGEVVGINVYMYAVLLTAVGYVPMIDGTLAVKLDDFLPSIWGIIETHKALQVMVDEFAVAQKHIDDLNRSRPD